MIMLQRQPKYGGTIERIAIFDIFMGWRPGSRDLNDEGEPWTWVDEAGDIVHRICACCDRPGHYQEQLVAKMEVEGEFWDDDEPIILGDDGRVWEGHHRILGGARLLWPDLPVERMSDQKP